MLLKLNPRYSQSRVAKSRHSSGVKPSKWLLSPLFVLSVWFGYHQARSYWTQPEAIFVLGGHEERERFAAKFAQEHDLIPIFVSSGSPEDYARKIFAKARIERDRIHLDYQAKDTVTNFTTLVNELQAENIDSVYLITSKNHLFRAWIIGSIVFGSKGILFKPISVPSNYPPEPPQKSLRDGIRAILWVFTGDTGEHLKLKVKS